MQAGPADAVSDKQFRQARERYRQVQEQLNKLAEEYAKQEDRAENLELRIKATNRSMGQASAEAEALQKKLRGRVRVAYRLGGLGFFDFLLTSHSFRDFSLRAVMLERQTSHDEDLMLKLHRAQARLNAQRGQLKAQKKSQSRLLEGLRQRAAQFDSAFGSAKALLARLEDQKRAEELAVYFRTQRGSVRGMVVALSRCPAAGPHAFSNDWHAPRGGGKRRHQGNDIFAPMGSPAVATVSGVVKRHGSGGAGGLSIYLWGDNGVEFYYAHMSGFAAPVGARVSAGQVIGYVGNTGNARGGAAHIHFEIHPGGGGAINPYPSLVRVC